MTMQCKRDIIINNLHLYSRIGGGAFYKTGEETNLGRVSQGHIWFQICLVGFTFEAPICKSPAGNWREESVWAENTMYRF